MRKTKIVCTVGPSTDDDQIMYELIKSGMDVARFNFSHGDYESHKRRFEQVVKARTDLNKTVATMLDTKGPEIRLGVIENDEPVILNDGDKYTLTTKDVICNKKIAHISFEHLPRDVKCGDRIMIDDGLVELKVDSVTMTDIECTVVHGGKISNRKGINVPDVSLSMPYVSHEDMKNLEFGASLGFDFIAASFTRSAADIIFLREFTRTLGWNKVRIIAKIENLEGVQNIDEILEASDGIMVARGDMGVEIPFEQIPAIQKELIEKGYTAGKQVITATQMLESMISNSRPTRAEITDVANAIYDGTSAIMLSGETASGKYPVQAVKTMAKIAETTENNINYTKQFSNRIPSIDNNISNAIAHAATTTAHDLGAKAIIAVTMTGKSSRLVSKYRPQTMIIGCSPDIDYIRQMNMSWGVTPVYVPIQTNSDELFCAAIESAKKAGLVEKGDLVVICAGVPLSTSGSTNIIRVETV